MLLRLFNTLVKHISFYRLFPVRRRYVLTRTNRLRARYVTACVAVVLILSLCVSALVSPSVAYVAQDTDHSPSSSASSMKNASLSGFGLENVASAFFDSFKDAQNPDVRTLADLAPAGGEGSIIVPPTPPVKSAKIEKKEARPAGPHEEVIHISSGETVAGVLQDVGLSGVDALNIVKAMSEHFDPRDVRAGQTLEVRVEPGQEGLEFESLKMKIDPIKEVVVSKKAENDFQAKIVERPVYVHVDAVNASIDNSLYSSAAHAGIPASVVSEMIRIYSYQVDFQRDIKQGDKFEILYETYKTADGDFARYGNILYANLAVNGRKIPVYRYETPDGQADYYGEDGMTFKKSLMRTPVDGARISSGFGMRRHPISGYTKMHKGIDFAVALGTPVYAAGDGVVEVSGRKGTYGNYVRIRHTKDMKTAYAHLHKIAKGITPGQKVKQGQVIGYVGTTGRSTGPHLHYEVIVNNQQVNPNSVKLPTGHTLAGAEMKRFKEHVSSVKQQYASLTEGLKYAQYDPERD